MKNNSKKKLNKNKSLDKDIRRLVSERLGVMPSNRSLSIGGDNKFYTRDKLIEEVNKGTKTGNKIIKIEMEYLQSLKNLSLYAEQATLNN